MEREHGSSSYTATRHHQNGAAAAGAGATMPEDPMLTDMMDYYFVRKTESYKFIRMADDLHNVANYLSEMRMCFLLLTGTVYIILAIYFVTWCIRRNRRRVNNPSGTGAGGNRRLPNQRWGELQGNDYENALTAQTNVGQTEDLVSVRSDGALPPGKVQPAGIGTGASQFGMAGRAANRQAAPTFMRHSAAASTMQNHSGGTGGGGGGSTGGGGATTRLMADVDTGTAMMVSTTAAAAAAKQQQSSPHLGGVHHHHHHPTAVAHLQHSPHSAEQQQQQTLGQSAGRSPACLLNNIAEEKESSGGSNSGSSSTAGTMSTFGWRNKEKVLLEIERHELQTMSDNV